MQIKQKNLLQTQEVFAYQISRSQKFHSAVVRLDDYP